MGRENRDLAAEDAMRDIAAEQEQEPVDAVMDDSAFEGDVRPETELPEGEMSEEARIAAAMEALAEENASLKDQLMRAVAEQENLRRRFDREKDDLRKFAGANFAKELLGVIDNMERALQSVPEDAREADGLVGSLLAGVEATGRELQSAFQRAGIERIDPLDEKFDPNMHEVMFEVENTGKPPGTVVQILQSGFVMHGRLLRPARVGVAKGSGGGDATGAQLDTEA